MRPTLYADDILGVREGERRPWEDELEILARVLPLRCPCDTQPTSIKPPVDCDGRGWLYPDPPDWWEDLIMNDEFLRREYTEERRRDMLDTMTEEWHKQLRNVWRAMGILEED